MKTLFKTVTVVSIATLTAIGTTKLNINTYSGTTKKQENTSALNIYIPKESKIKVMATEAAAITSAERKIIADNMKVASDLETTNLLTPAQTKTKAGFYFTPASEIEVALEPVSAEDQKFNELIKFKPADIDVNEAVLNSVIAFVPSEIAVEEIVEPVSFEQLIKFSPSANDYDEIIEPASSFKELIKFKPSNVIISEIEEPVDFTEMIKFKPIVDENQLVVEPTDNCNSTLVTK
ncbi:hypothetical protein [Solitalea lacus]|uniref:hypothetical protein n=1 Tax=Solitalea lacus TaxID=2911172 RepID=UPI001ED9DBC5|nr:hypothetical protein [Solitalea lacus]UKJ08665.1 hypothetical protein L2B55_05720 [Solitalea lacus]